MENMPGEKCARATITCLCGKTQMLQKIGRTTKFNETCFAGDGFTTPFYDKNPIQPHPGTITGVNVRLLCGDSPVINSKIKGQHCRDPCGRG